jgi:hypothetical protein
VRSFPASKWLLLAAILAVTLGWKLVARSTVVAPPNVQDIQAVVAEFLVRQHFAVAIAEHAEEGRPSITAKAGPCRMLVAESPAVGWDREMIRRYAEADDHVFVVFRGHVYPDQPTFSTAVDALWARFRRQLGGRVQPHPVLAVVAKPTCGAEGLPWGDLVVAGP